MIPDVQNDTVCKQILLVYKQVPTSPDKYVILVEEQQPLLCIVSYLVIDELSLSFIYELRIVIFFFGELCNKYIITLQI